MRAAIALRHVPFEDLGLLAPLLARRGWETSYRDAAVLHWHGDTFDLPRGAVLLASTNLYPNQAFAWKNHALALQFHLEATASGLERWYIGHAAEIASVPGLTVAALRAQAHRHASALAPLAEQCFAAWLDGIH